VDSAQFEMGVRVDQAGQNGHVPKIPHALPCPAPLDRHDSIVLDANHAVRNRLVTDGKDPSGSD
jgi:hypothetical protein